ncbi:zinc finger protein OZF-like isoform X2 [Thalassophryne amazonica]|uniref:zinc finger protein OZF-like isoform X2 n=1 Tax=Thalassophryne amazonica TaxID=390379 RepID=UPI0014710F8C|nr:zinc finger protein OZF-like isoform X2 [Thalassophryne amazonica]
MSKVELMRELVSQRLAAAAEDIYILFERTFVEYEQELKRSKEENSRQHKLLQAVFDEQQVVLVGKQPEIPPEQPDCIVCVDVEDAQSLQMKEKQLEPGMSLQQARLQSLDEADILKTPFPPVHVESGNDGEKPQSSQLHHIRAEFADESLSNILTEHVEAEIDGQSCGGSEIGNPDLESHFQLRPGDSSTNPSESETEDSDDWIETSKREPGLNCPKNDEVSVNDTETKTSENPFSGSVIDEEQGHMTGFLRSHTGKKKPFICFKCGRRFSQEGTLNIHMMSHSEENPFSCKVCMKIYSSKSHLKRHMAVHTGEKPFSCSVCNTRFTQKSSLNTHMKIHTGEKPFSCSKCSKQFSERRSLEKHMLTHLGTGEKPFSCFKCGRRFRQKGTLNVHMMSHSAEKPYCCTVCDKGFGSMSHLKRHMTIHE